MVAAAHAELAEVRAHHVQGVSAALQVIRAGCDGFTINCPTGLFTKHITDTG